MPDQTPDWRSIVRTRLRGQDTDPDALDEIVEHAEELYRSLRSSGASAEQARTDVESEMTDLPSLMRSARAARRRRLAPQPEPPPPGRASGITAFLRDLAHGVRLLVARPAFTAIAVITLALGIGANTAIFSLVHAVMLAPLPFPAADRIVRIWENTATAPDQLFIVSAPNYLDWQRQATSFQSMAIWEHRQFNVATPDEPVQVNGMRVSASLFPLLGVRPQLGRTFTEQEDAPGHDVAVLSDRIWRAHFGARADIVGQTIRINGRPHEVVGVMPPSFVFIGRLHQVYVPIAFNTEADADRGSHSFQVAARLKDGVTFNAAKAEVEAIAARLAKEHPDNEGESATITHLTDYGAAGLPTTFAALMGAVGLLLLIACVNVANLLLAQASARQREFSIRFALGASRARIAVQLLAEGLLLAVAGGAAGIVVAWAALSLMTDVLPWTVANAPFRSEIGAPVSMPVLVFTLAVAVVTAVIFSFAPLLGLRSDGTGAALKATGGRGGTMAHSRPRAFLIAAEVALAVVILAGAGLLIKSMSRLFAVDPGLNAENVFLSSVALPQKNLYGPPERTTFCADVENALKHVPGLIGVGAVSHVPLSGASAGRALSLEGHTPPPQGFSAAYRLSCPGYFQALGIGLVRGRDFTHADATTAPGVAIVNEELVKQYWPNEDPIGRRLKIGGADSPNRWLMVVGVVRTVRHFGLDAAPSREIFLPYSQSAWPGMTVVVKSATDTPPAEGIRRALRGLDPERPVPALRSMNDIILESAGPRRFPMLLLTAFAVVALVLAVIGVFGVVSYLVTQRTREMGIRLALGAQASQLVSLVVGKALIPIAAGLVVGAVAAFASSRLVASFLFEVKPNDPTVVALAVFVLGASGLIASLVPARRAAAVDPIVVLKEE